MVINLFINHLICAQSTPFSADCKTFVKHLQKNGVQAPIPEHHPYTK